ncbi:hypothetical protein [Roseateles sp.]|uniref:SDH family Clp fold serine proteinase n=1 Tax=Roseateles sp. TaxID=1971397 RepID=UPI0031E14B85
MAVMLKEAEPSADAPAGPQDERPLAPPFDVVTYAGPVTMEGYERLSGLLEGHRASDRVLIVLETSGGDPHAAFRISRALGFHYEQVEALIPRCCKSAGTLIVLGASVLHMDDRGELGPLDMQVPRAHEFSNRGSALEFSGVLDVLLPYQLRTLEASMQELTAQGLSADLAAHAASLLVGHMFHPIVAQVEPHRLVEMTRAMAIAEAYGDRLALRGGNIDPKGVRVLARRYPSHGFAIDRKEARLLFRDVRVPEGAVATVARHCRDWSPSIAKGRKPTIEINPFSFTLEELTHGHDIIDSRFRTRQGTAGSSHSEDVSRPVRHGSEVGGGADGAGGQAGGSGLSGPWTGGY